MGKRGQNTKQVPGTPTYRDPLTGVYAFPASFAENFARNLALRFAKSMEK
jgi:5,10-methenyltetrahydromethanopterin hydrogenase